MIDVSDSTGVGAPDEGLAAYVASLELRLNGFFGFGLRSGNPVHRLIVELDPDVTVMLDENDQAIPFVTAPAIIEFEVAPPAPALSKWALLVLVLALAAAMSLYFGRRLSKTA